MSSSTVDENESIALRLIGIIVLLVVALAVGFGVFKARSGAKPTAAPVTAQQPPPQLLEEDVAAVVVENGMVKFFFATASAELAGGANMALGELVKARVEGRMLVISGYHDASGDPALNAELAKKRALAVREALLTLGVAEAAIELKKPALSTGTGTAREARRVEVRLR